MILITSIMAIVFCILAGRNDGSAIIALQLRTQWRVTALPFVILLACIALTPLASIRVGGTVTGLLSVEGIESRISLILILMATCGTLLILNIIGIPTSITLALVGASSGVGFAYGDANWATVLRVLTVALLSPFIAFALSRAIYAICCTSKIGRSADTVLLAGFTAVCVAYGANDGQKISAVMSSALGLGLERTVSSPVLVAASTALFLMGAILGMKSGATFIQRGTLVPDSLRVGITLWSAAIAVLASSALGTPVSMTQSLSGALVGTCPSNDWRRVRWAEVKRIALAWAATLPTAWILGWGAATCSGASGLMQLLHLL